MYLYERWLVIASTLFMLLNMYNCMEQEQDTSSGDDMMNVAEPIIIDSQTSLNVVYGQNLILNCTIYNTVDATITWDTTAPVTLPSPVRVDDTSSITLTNVNTSHTGHYTCSVFNEYGMDNFTVTVSITIPLPLVTVTPDTIQQEPSLPVQFTCVIYSVTKANISWISTASNKTFTITPQGDNSILLIDYLLPSHMGTYTCVAVNEGGENSSTAILNVTVNIPNVTISVADEAVSQYNISYNDSVDIVCTIISFVPVTSQWINDSQVLNSQTENDGVSIYTNVLTISTADLYDRASYICTANNSAGTANAKVDIGVIVDPPVITPIPSQTITVGYNVTFVCNASGYGLTYRWTSDPAFLNCPDEFPLCIQGFNEPILNIFSIPQTYSANVTCNVTDLDGQFVTYTTELIVNGLVLVNCTYNDDDLVIERRENETFSLNCTYKYPPDILEPLDITWSEDGRAISAQDPPDNIIINTVNTTDGYAHTSITFNPYMSFYQTYYPLDTFRRSYLCDAVVGRRRDNIVRGGVVDIDVLFTPYIRPETQNLPMNPTRIDLGSTLTVACYAIGNPFPQVYYEDVTNGTAIRLSEIKETGGEVSYTINVAQVSNLTYRCVANNTFGLRFYEFIVIIQDHPDIINSNNIIVTTVSLFTVRISWPIPYDNMNSILEYNVTYYQLPRGLTKMTSVLSPINSIDIRTRTIDTNYSFSVSTINGVGSSEPSNEIIFQSISTVDASLYDVSIPRILLTRSSIYLQWSYPELLVNPLLNEDPQADVEHVQIRIESSRLSNDIVVNVDMRDTSVNITEGLEADTRYTLYVNIFYNQPSYLQKGKEVILETQTLPEDNQPVEKPEVEDDLLVGAQPVLSVSWTPLDTGAEYLSQYIVRVTSIQLTQSATVKRQTDQSTTQDYIVDKDTTSFEVDAKPFTLYTTQVLAELNINGNIRTLPVTGEEVATSSESTPGAPQDVIVSDITSTTITLTWQLPDPPNGVITDYNIYLTQEGKDVGNVTTVSGNTYTLTLTDLTGHVTYTYRISAITSVGEGNSTVVQSVTTLAGVSTPQLPNIESGSGRTLLVTVPKLSTRHGPLSHYVIVILSGISQDTSSIINIYPHTDTRWRSVGYYATAALPVTDDDQSYIIGNSSTTQWDGTSYYNAPLEYEIEYRVFIRVYSSVEMTEYSDSPLTVTIKFTRPSTVNIAAVVIPIVLVVVALIVVIIIILMVIFYLRRGPKHGTETFYLDEIKSSVKPLDVDSFSPARNGNTSVGRAARGGAVTAPVLALHTAEVYTSIGQPTVLLCEVKGNPQPDVLWSRDGCTLQEPNYRTLADGSLYIVNTDLKDDGNYIVSAYNDGGRVEEALRVFVIVPTAPEPDMNRPSQSVSDFIGKMAILHSTMDDQLEVDYHDIELEWNITVYNAKLPVNHNKNRYVNIIPYDHSRVSLCIQENSAGSDYINASYIDGYNEANAYIATQGPIPSTFPDFWRMLWELDVPTITMVTNLKEDDKIKCHQYWPSYGTAIYGDIQVSLKEIENIVNYSIRTFQIQPFQGGPTKEVRQFHFQVWPDHGVPQYATALLGFRKRITQYHPVKRGPMVVHCSAGVGRTGTFICIDSMMKMIEMEGKVDVFNFVRQMRFRRNYMVQTSTQYEFIHEALLETIMCGDTSLPVKSLHQKVAELYEVDPKTGKSGFLTQFQTLESSCPAVGDFDCSIAQLPDNQNKTRALGFLPPNDNRVVLSTNKYDSDYICATFIDGYRQRQCFITTQGPMKNTAGDFWRMIWEYSTSAIVMLTELEEEGIEQCVQYWPNGDEQEIYGSFAIRKCQEERVLPDYTVRKFTIHHIENSSEERTVSHFHYTNWPHNVCPSNGTSINDLISEVLRVQRMSGNNPITVHCSDGLGRTGTFCGAFTVLERVKAEQVVDIFSTVKSLRIQHPGLLQSLDQYEFIHKIVLEFLTTFDNYNNFK